MILKKADQHCLALGLKAPELSVVLCDDEFIQGLNAQWRQEDSTTDVLSFGMFEADEEILPGSPLGDIIINIEYAERLVTQGTHTSRVALELGVNESELSWGLEEETNFLLIHGLLHLVGYDHATEDEEVEMKQMEAKLWRAQG